MKRFFLFTLAALALQVAAVILVLVAAFGLGMEALALVPMFFYYPTILLVEGTGNFVGCANMIQPLIIGVPLGWLAYGIIFGMLVSRFTTLHTRISH